VTTVRLADAPAAILSYATQGGRPVILLDGGSGAGKTSLAASVAEAWRTTRGEELLLVSLDDVYPGWHGLAAGSAAVPRILAALDPGYRRWDWERSQPADWVAVNPHAPILIEGCGALTLESAILATCRVWLELDESVRKVRALARDKGGYDPYWDMWAAQEQSLWRQNHPWTLADLTVKVS
jgi:uridine kinase